LTFDSNWNLTSNNTDQVTQISCSYDNISSVNWIWSFTNLTNLNLSGNQLKTLPSGIWNLVYLQELNLNYNNGLGNLANDFDYYSGSKTAKVVDTTWNWIPDTNMTIKGDQNNYTVNITVWNNSNNNTISGSLK